MAVIASIHSFASEAWYAAAVPAKKPRTVPGIFSRCCICETILVASLNDMFEARLNDTVTDGKELVWLMMSGVVRACAVVTVESGTTPLPEVLR
jgi:hypothetical protein